MPISRRLIIDALAFEAGKAYGFQEFMFNLLEYFYKNRNELRFDEVIIVCLETQKNEFDRYKEKFQIVAFPITNIICRLLYQQIMPWKINVAKSDVVLNLYNYSSFFVFCKNVLVIHDLLYLRKELLPVWYIRLHRKLFIARSVANANHIIAISKFTKHEILNNILASRNKPVSVVYNYFNFEKYYSDVDFYSDFLRNSFFLCVSSSAFHKNIITIIKAFEHFCLLNKNLNLYFVGAISNPDALNYYSKLTPNVKNRIKFFTKISNKFLGKLYQNCHAYISASYFEGLGMPVIEAMYFKVQLILSDIEIFREITRDNAYFFDPNSTDELVQRMIQSIDLKSHENYFDLTDFSAANTSSQYIKILNNI